MQRFLRGYTLTEIMIVVAIVAIIAAIGYPQYQNYTREARRADGHSALTRVAAQQERFFSDSNLYTADLTDLGYGAATTLSPDGHYLISSAIAGATFTLTATPQGPQAADAACSPMTLTHLGVKAPAACW
ncbi:MAG: type IV pilin protein [Gammaproteobacteria bacterium]|nr:type IV pilin protein [Gammaproteobacteria bacterium]